MPNSKLRKRGKAAGSDALVPPIFTHMLMLLYLYLGCAPQDADAVYTDSWMSYTISEETRDRRVALLQPFQVSTDLLNLAKPDVIFMNCLPAMRGMEQTAEVMRF